MQEEKRIKEEVDKQLRQKIAKERRLELRKKVGKSMQDLRSA